MKSKFSESIRVALFVVFGATLMYVVYAALNRLSIKQSDGYQVKALFSDLKQLQVGDDVRVAGVRVGSVINTYLQNEYAVAVLNIEKRYQIPEDSVATISMAGLLGANYIAIVPGKGKSMLVDDEFVKTQNAVDLSAVIQKFGDVGKKLDRILTNVEDDLYSDPEEGDAKKSGSLLKDLSSFFRENRGKFNAIIDNCQVITQNLAQGNGTLGKLIVKDDAYNTLMDILQSVKEIANNINDHQGVLGKLISDEKMSQDFDAIVKNIRSFTEKLNSNTSTLGRIITEDSLYNKAESVLNKVDKATDTLSNSGPITAVGAAASALF